MSRLTTLQKTAEALSPEDRTEFQKFLDRAEQNRIASAAVRDAASVPGAPAPLTTRRAQVSEQAQAQSNTVTFDQLLAKATELGTQAGQGKDTQIKFYLTVTEGAFVGKLDLDANKHGQDVDDATKLAEAYVKAQTGSTIFDAKANNQRKLIACVRTGIKLGSWTKGGPQEPMNMVNQFIVARQTLRKDPANAKRLDDAANAFLRLARAQLKRDSIISGDELKLFAFKVEHGAATEEDMLVSLRKKMQNSKVGKGTPCDPSTADKIITAITHRLKEIAKGKGVQPADAKAGAAQMTAQAALKV